MATEFKVLVKTTGGDFATMVSASDAVEEDMVNAYTGDYDNLNENTGFSTTNRTEVNWDGGASTGYCCITRTTTTGDAHFCLAVDTGSAPEDDDRIEKDGDSSTYFDVDGTPSQGVQMTFDFRVVGDTTLWKFDGGNWVTSADCYVKIITPLSERHQGYWDETKPYMHTSNGTRLTHTPYQRWEGIQLTSDDATATLRWDNPVSGSTCYMDSCIIRHNNDSGGHAVLLNDASTANYLTLYMSNCVIDRTRDGGYGLYCRAGNLYFYNVTLRVNTSADAIRVRDGNHYFKNCIISNEGSGGNITFTSGTQVFDHVAGDDGDIDDQWTKVQVISSGTCDDTVAGTLQDADGDFASVEIGMACTDGSNYTTITAIHSGYCSVDSDIFANTESYEIGAVYPSSTFSFTSSQDCHLLSTDAGAINRGRDLSADSIFPFSTDIDNESRSNWDLGADEYISAVVPGTVCWGHATAIYEDNAADFDEGDGGVDVVVTNPGAGDSEVISIPIHNDWTLLTKNPGTGRFKCEIDKYSTPGSGLGELEYRTGTSLANCEAQSWTTIDEAEFFTSLGWVQVRLSN